MSRAIHFTFKKCFFADSSDQVAKLEESFNSLTQDDSDRMSDPELDSEERNLEKLEKDYEETKELKQRFKKIENMYIKSERLRKLMKTNFKKKKRIWNSTVNKLEKKVRMLESNPQQSIFKIMNVDQYRLLSGECKKLPKWCDETLIKAYQLKFSCGVTGYNELQKQNFPLPSLRVLRRKLENWKFESGKPQEVFKFLKLKVAQFNKEIDKDCLLVLDEISITEGLCYDPANGTFVGNVNLPGHVETELATHGLVIMLCGIASRWKQVIDYFYTGDSTDGTKYGPLLVSYIRSAHECGLYVIGIVNDMGGPNQAMWRYFGINCSRYSTVVNKCQHPVDKDGFLYFFHDSSHAFKNLKEGFLNSSTINISDDYVSKYNLPTNVAQSSHFARILDEDKEFDLKLAPKLTQELLEKNRHFQKMRVKNATHVLNFTVSTALQFLGEEYDEPELQTTAWIVSNFAKWFQILSCRTLTWALSKHDPEKYKETREFLEGLIELIRNLRFGSKGEWKPYQKGLIITTQSFLDVTEFLLEKRKYKFVIAGRFTQDCIENLFSVLRMKNCVLNALQFKNNLKLITISHYMRRVATSNYDEDDRQFLPDFLKMVKDSKKSSENENSDSVNIEPFVEHEDFDKITVNNTQLNILHLVAGYLIRSITRTEKCCKQCVLCTGNLKFQPAFYNRLTSIRCFGKDTLFFVNERTLKFFLQMEKVFVGTMKNLTSFHKFNLRDYFIKKFMEIPYILPNCHQLKQKIAKRFAIFRLKVRTKRKNKNIKNDMQFASKTMAMHARAK